MFDCHMHTKFSIDSNMDASNACETAISLGLDGIAFTDHIDFDFPGEDCLIDFNQYFAEMTPVREKYRDRIKLLNSVEVGIQPHVLTESMELITGYPFDYVLASVHVMDGIDPYMREFYKGKSKIEAYERYLQEIYFMIKNFESFDMVGHFEYIIRYSSYADRTLRYNDHKEILDAIMIELIQQGRGFEVNTGTFRNETADAQYDFEVLKRYRELGGELICLGSDAHRLEHIGIRFDYFAQMLRDAGFKYTVHFEERKPVFDRL
jgi:histidinol-phosphatase (PHP family)